ncbi:hypothetical protein M747DRAFT_101385 [Aspergillus niger ATCC 13496]|nr:hypothetical protein M747DRAFT_101385 [Aspergillus niger ATCC 13496]
MLLRGAKLPPPTLDNADIQAVKNKAHHSGRSHGGAPLRNGHRGGRINYASERPNPFAAHLDPKFMPPGNSGGAPMGMPAGWVPPNAGGGNYNRGPPPPPRGGGGGYHQRSHYGGGGGGDSYNQPTGNYDYYGRSQQGYYQQGSYGGSNHNNAYRGRSNNYGGSDQRGGYSRGGYSGRDHYSSRNSGGGGGYGRY